MGRPPDYAALQVKYPNPRRPVGVASGPSGVYVVCDDGSVWCKGSSGWIETWSIPGSSRALSGSTPTPVQPYGEWEPS